jgi:hypothetical protein
MNEKIKLLQLILEKASYHGDYLKCYLDDTLTVAIKDHVSMTAMLDMAKEITKEMLLP